MTDTIIADAPPNDGREWDAQCARCGASVERADCDVCGGDGYLLFEDYWQRIGDMRCDNCDGSGGWLDCASGAKWCEANPLPGREGVERGAVEWFVTREVPRD